MTNHYFIVLVFILIVPLSGCTQNINLSNGVSENVNVFLYIENESFGPYMVFVTSDRYLKLQAWLNSNKTGWRESYLMPFDSTLAPIEIRSSTYILKVFDNTAYIKLDKKILSKKIEKDEFQYFMDMKQ